MSTLNTLLINDKNIIKLGCVHVFLLFFYGNISAILNLTLCSHTQFSFEYVHVQIFLLEKQTKY